LADSAQKTKENNMNQRLEAKIAWLLVNLLDDVTEQLWNRYDKEFVEFAMEEEKKDILIGERISEMDPDSPLKPEL
jgi:hypothetical protein